MFLVIFSTEPLPGGDVPCKLPSFMSAVLSLLYPVCFLSDHVPDWTWFGFVYIVTTAGFVAYQFVIWNKQEKQTHMTTNISVQYNGVFLPDIIFLTLCSHHRGSY